jgi:hypothetical protein
MWQAVPTPLIDLDSARDLLRAAMPDWEWFIAHLESEQGYFRFPKEINDLIVNLKIEAYPLLYEKGESAIGAAIGLSLMDLEDLRRVDNEMAAASAYERGQKVIELCRDLDEIAVDFQLPSSGAELLRARDEFSAMPPEDQAKSIRFWQFFWMGFLSGFYQYLSLMVHGEKLTALVAQAKTGSRTAFAKAVQIDKRILTVIPYFKEQYERAGTEGDSEFLDDVGRRLTMPPYKGKIRHKSLWMTFAVLDGFGLLRTMTHESILNFCDSVGVGGHKNRIEDVKNLSKRLRQYFDFQERGMVIESTP